jgi:hypothetical protein
MFIAALAWNIKAWFAVTMHRKTDQHDCIRIEFRSFFHTVVLIPAMIVHTARGITVRLVGYTPAVGRLSAPVPPSNGFAAADHGPHASPRRRRIPATATPPA